MLHWTEDPPVVLVVDDSEEFASIMSSAGALQATA
jgi:hypothetical protein